MYGSNLDNYFLTIEPSAKVAKTKVRQLKSCTCLDTPQNVGGLFI